MLKSNQIKPEVKGWVQVSFRNEVFYDGYIMDKHELKRTSKEDFEAIKAKSKFRPVYK